MPQALMIGAPPPEISYLGTNPTGVAIGAARSDRLIVVFCFGESDAGAALSSMTIGGNAATIINNPTMSDPMGCGYLNVPTGTTVDISASMSGLQRYEIFMITGLQSGVLDTSQATSTSGSTCTQSLTTAAAQSAIICGARSRSSMGSYTVTGSGTGANMVVNAYGNSGGGGNHSWVVGSGLADTAGSATINENGSGAFSSGYGFAASFI